MQRAPAGKCILRVALQASCPVTRVDNPPSGNLTFRNMPKDAENNRWQSVTDLIEDELRQVEETVRIRAETPLVKAMLERIHAIGGKRMRPVLLLLSGKAIGPIGPKHVTVAAAIELSHCATLLHDDVIDGAEIRRGQSCSHVLWGSPSAVLMGDLMFSEAFKLVCDLNEPAVTASLCRAVSSVCEGEILQWQRSFDAGLSESDYLEITSRKTGALCAGACRAGALLSGATQAQADACFEFGSVFGTAYQVADDYADLFCSNEDTGKTAGRDLEGGRYTLPVLRAMAAGRDAGDNRLRRALEERDVDAARRLLLDDCIFRPAAESTMEAALNLAEKAKISLKILPRSEALSGMETMADSVGEILTAIGSGTVREGGASR